MPRRTWFTSSARSQTVLTEQAAAYLKAVDLEEMARWDSPEMMLAKVVCNLRHYHRQSPEQTVALIQRHYCPRRWASSWSRAAVLLTWKLVEPFTPDLGLSDRQAVAAKQAAELEEAVIDFLLECTEMGGSVSTDDLFQAFQRWVIEAEASALTETSPIEFGRRVVQATGGIGTKVRQGRRVHPGFTLKGSFAELGGAA